MQPVIMGIRVELEEPSRIVEAVKHTFVAIELKHKHRAWHT